jgi:hypothetical protein
MGGSMDARVKETCLVKQQTRWIVSQEGTFTCFKRHSPSSVDLVSHQLTMRTHVWRKQLTRLSQRGQRLPFQRLRAFHTVTRQLEAHPSPDQETANLETAITESATKPSASTRRGRLAQRRPKEVTPFTVPDWFLRYNVRLHAPTGDATANQESRCWTLVDRDSGHTVLTLPFTVDPSDQSNDFFTPSTQPKEKMNNETVSPASEIRLLAPSRPTYRLLLLSQLQTHVLSSRSSYSSFFTPLSHKPVQLLLATQNQTSI